MIEERTTKRAASPERSRAGGGTERLYFSIIRIVPDPVKDEAVNVGVAVTRAEGVGGAIRTHTKGHVRARLKSLQPDFDFEALDWELQDLESALGLHEQLGFGESGMRPTTETLLHDVAARLKNQLQLTVPQRYLAAGPDEAADELFKRYVSTRARMEAKPERLTHAALRDQIWRVVRTWSTPVMKLEQGRMLQGTTATHPADIVISNGHPRVALYALPTQLDQTITFLYRDALPTIAQDMGDDFSVYAVLPPLRVGMSKEERGFAEETRALLGQHERVKAVELTELEDVRAEVVRTLV